MIKVFFLMLLSVLFSLIACDSQTDEKNKSSAQFNAQHFSNINNQKLCPPLQPAAENSVAVDSTQVGMLPTIISTAKPGDTILLLDGVYNLNGINLWLSTPGVSLRSASGNPDTVILDGAYNTTQIITVAASDITIAEITITRASTHPIHVISSDTANTENTLIYRINIIDPREQAIKINPHARGSYADNGTIACSSIKLTDQGRQHINKAAGGCYTGGIDAHQASGWTVRDNYFEGFWCDKGLSQHAIHFWTGSRDTLIERNYLKDNARGIGLGLNKNGDARTYNDNPCPDVKDVYIGHYRGIIRNNFIHSSSPGLFNSSDGADCGICLSSACKTVTTHNTVVSTDDSFSSIEWRFPGSVDQLIYNNIVTHSLKQRNGASALVQGNLEKARLSLFVDGRNGDLHLKKTASSAIDKGLQLKAGGNELDFDHQHRNRLPDIGADEIISFDDNKRN